MNKVDRPLMTIFSCKISLIGSVYTGIVLMYVLKEKNIFNIWSAKNRISKNLQSKFIKACWRGT